VVVGDLALRRLADFEPRQVAMHVTDEVVGVVFAAAPVIEPQVALLLDRLCRGSSEESLALRRGERACEVTRQILFVFRVNPPGTNNSCPDPHRNPPWAR